MQGMRVTGRSRGTRIFILHCELYGVLSGTGQLHREFVFFSYSNHCVKNNEEGYEGVLKKRTKVEEGGTKKLGK